MQNLRAVKIATFLTIWIILFGFAVNVQLYIGANDLLFSVIAHLFIMYTVSFASLLAGMNLILNRKSTLKGIVLPSIFLTITTILFVLGSLALYFYAPFRVDLGFDLAVLGSRAAFFIPFYFFSFLSLALAFKLLTKERKRKKA